MSAAELYRILRFLRIAAWAHYGALARATVHAAEHRRYPRALDVPYDVREAIALGDPSEHYAGWRPE